ncbi:tetratricopeptide repeat protein [Pontibacter sp. CAU 1760]
MKQPLLLSLILLLVLACGRPQVQEPEAVATTTTVPKPITMCAPPATVDTLWYTQNTKAPLFDGLDGIDFKITTTNPEAQRYFNQGLMLAYGFNHAEAARSFYEATRQDSACAMCHWGYSYVLGPNYNAGMELDNFTRAYRAVQKAKRFAPNTSPKEQALIAALEKRYPPQPVDDRLAYDVAYADALQQVYTRYPTDPNIGAMYAESRMNLHPWDLWEKDGKPKPWTGEILQVLEGVMKQAPRHAGANHFYIHATEASHQPEKANKSAQLLETLVPGAGHLLHMPSHTYIRTGNYHAGTLANQRAVQADSAYTSACHAQGAYPLAYYPHNYHFMAATATMEGNGELALFAANKLAEHVNTEVMKTKGWETLQHYHTIPYFVAVKFGKWDRILQLKKEDVDLTYPSLIRHYARGMAYVGKNDLPKAKAELAQLEKLAAKEDELKEMTIWELNSMYDIGQIAKLVLQGEVLAKEGSYDQSIRVLREAIAIEDNLNYNEPPDWFFSVRHHLGAVLLAAKQYQEAASLYTQDLAMLPKNGWALSGLAQAYAGTGEATKASATQKQFEDAWQWADVQLHASKVQEQ